MPGAKIESATGGMAYIKMSTATSADV